MPSFSTTYIEPGPYIKIQNVPAPNVTGATFIPIFVGIGSKAYDINTSLVRGSGLEDLITDDYSVIDILSIINTTTNQIYKKGLDFILDSGTNLQGPYQVNWVVPGAVTIVTGVAQNPGYTYNVQGQTLNITVDGVSQNITFANNDIASALVTEINAAFAPLTPAAVGAGLLINQVVITGNTLVYIDSGTALTELGWQGGDKVQSSQPTIGTSYSITYKRLKLSTDYDVKLFSRLTDVYAEHGPAVIPNVLVSGTVISSTNVAPYSLTGNPVTDDFSGVSLGNYVKITSGTGMGQIKVVAAVNVSTATVTFIDSWTIAPDGTSVYLIYDGPYSEISIGVTIAQTHGATMFMTSQSPNDIVDDNNLRLAIDNTEEIVSGFQGWVLVYQRGVDASDSIVSYITSYIDKMNGVTTKQERMALFGMKASTTDFTDVITLTTGIAADTGVGPSRIGVVATPFGTINGIGQLDGSYVASAIAGIICNPNYDPGEPITSKIIQFDYIDDPYLRSEKRQIAGNGGIVIEQQGVNYVILHYLSTDVSDIIGSELKVIKQIDDLKKTLRSTIQSALLNMRITNGGKNILAMANSLMNLILSEKVKAQYISGYQNLSIQFDNILNVGGDPRQLDISFQFTPVFDLNWIYVNFGASIAS